MYVTRHSEISDASLTERLWVLYSRAYLRTARETPTHEMLDRGEFREQLASSVNRVWVVWDDGMPVGMALVSTDIRATRWLSETYFEHHFPDRYAAGKVHYVVWVVVDRAYGTGGAITMLARHALAAESRDGSLLVFDTPEINQPDEHGGAAELMFRLSKMVGDAQLLPLTTQRYYAVDFAPNTREMGTESDDSANRGANSSR